MKFAVPLLLLISCTSRHAANITLYPIVENNRFGFIDQKGNVIIPATFLNAGNFREGLAPVRLDGTWGYINTNGEFVIAAQFEHAGEFFEGIAIVNKDGKNYYIDKLGNQPFESVYKQIENFDGGRAIVQTYTDKYGLIDKQGRLAADTVFLRVVPTLPNRYLVQGLNHKDDSWSEPIHHFEAGVIDGNGKFIVPYGKYMEIGQFQYGYAAVSVAYENGDVSGDFTITGFIDTTGKFLYGQKSNGNAYVNGQAGDGSFQIQYTKQDDKGTQVEYIALMGMDGKPLLDDPKYTRINTFNCGRAFAEDEDRNYWLLDRKGKLVVSQPFQNVLNGQFFNNIAFVLENSKWKGIDTNGITVFPPVFEEIILYPVIDNYFRFSETKKETLYGIADTKGRIIIPAKLQKVDGRGFENELLRTVVDDRLAYFDTSGKQVWIQQSHPGDNKDTLNIDYMNRGYFYASSPYKKELAGAGGWGGSKNDSKSDIESLPVNNHRFEVYIDTTAKPAGKTPYPVYRLYIINTAPDSIFFEAQDSRLSMNMQAKDKDGNWKDIEYLPGSWCGNSYHTLFLAPGEYWRFSTPIYTGALKTELRAKLVYKENSDSHGNEKVIYSNVVRGGVNPGQFWHKPLYQPGGIMDPYMD